MTPRYVLDFDDTCFDTASLKQATFSFLASLGLGRHAVDESYLETRASATGYTPDAHAALLINRVAGDDDARAEELRDLYLARRHELADLMRGYVYPDAARFIAAHAHETLILTVGNRAFQAEKVATLGVTVPTIACADGDKALTLENHFMGNPGEFTFVDNLPENIDQIRGRFPQARTVLMDRSGMTPGSIATFDGL